MKLVKTTYPVGQFKINLTRWDWDRWSTEVAVDELSLIWPMLGFVVTVGLLVGVVVLAHRSHP